VRAAGRPLRSQIVAVEKVRLRIGNLAKAVLVTGQVYRDPKDALNEFVSNAADEYAQSGQQGARIRILLRRKGKRPVIAIDDVGRGMTPDRLREVARNLFESTKTGDKRTLGEKAIGLLAFQQLAGRCEIVSRPDGDAKTYTLRLERGRVIGLLEPERRRARTVTGTTVYLSDLDPEVLRTLTLRKIVDYLRRRRGAALARGDYAIEVAEGRRTELVTAEEPDGIRVAIPSHQTLWGRIEFGLYVAPRDDRKRRVAVVGRAGTTILDDLSELDPFDGPPWSTDQVSGHVAFDGLRQASGRRGVLYDGAFGIFIDALRAIEPAVTKALDRVNRDVDARQADRLGETIQRVFKRVLEELSDLDNPMRAPLGSLPGEGAQLEPVTTPTPQGSNGDTGPDTPTLGELDRGSQDLLEPPPDQALESARPDHSRNRSLPRVEPDPSPTGGRSRYNPDANVVLFNDRHTDYLLVKNDEATLLDYLATLVAKEYVVYNNPRAPSDELAEEMVRVVIRVRRHLPRAR
jgi:Histidine kinase-, DNA gyrase B-, and HSP90-like ATPase